ncbi:tRNA lysidine(34) synthetase TilS [Nocardioides sp.]|uniref:tRNA lysidine(34) synthetase TilS n=1 Tax=Nocardioides sp. TaxID=35761 RepID=UPI0027217AB4|nr:tRNA lysidine(34) synthetase TilS [Nocardioides sp.]MDO9456379.1 tRNA lysidine(34) synthetase TilS [Nocardioides sp.]
MTLDPAVAAVRLAVRRWLGPPDTATVLVACSGGADSLALLAATVFEARRRPLRVVGAVVDHGLQDGSADHTARVVAQMAALGVDETVSARVTVDAPGLGPEAGAREARYDVLDQMARHFGARQVLLGHTLDDQAETVLLGLARGSGGRSMAGMRLGFQRDDDVDGPHFGRPLLGVRREQTEAACRAEGIEWWTDPHNVDPRFARSRVRQTVLPVLERELGPGISEALARTADQLQADSDYLDTAAEEWLRDVYDADRGFVVWGLEPLAPAIRNRVLRLAALAAGSPPSELTAGHVGALAEQVLNTTHLPRQIQLPGHVTAIREGDVLRFVRSPLA